MGKLPRAARLLKCLSSLFTMLPADRSDARAPSSSYQPLVASLTGRLENGPRRDFDCLSAVARLPGLHRPTTHRSPARYFVAELVLGSVAWKFWPSGFSSVNRDVDSARISRTRSAVQNPAVPAQRQLGDWTLSFARPRRRSPRAMVHSICCAQLKNGLAASLRLFT